MVIDTYLVIPLTIFAIYGLTCFGSKILRSNMWLRKRVEAEGRYRILISVRDQSETLEEFMRDFIEYSDWERDKNILLQIGLLDVGSRDESPLILEQIVRQYPFIELLRPEEADWWVQKELKLEGETVQ